GSRAIFQIFRGADDHRRRWLSANRAAQPSLAGTATALGRRADRVGYLSSSLDLECRTRLGLVPVSGRPGRERISSVWADRAAGWCGCVPAPLDMGSFGGVRFFSAAARAVGQTALVAGLPRRAAADRVRRGLAEGQ